MITCNQIGIKITGQVNQNQSKQLLIHFNYLKLDRAHSIPLNSLSDIPENQ